MSSYYVSGCIGDGDAVATCDDSVAQFWTLYHRNDEGLSEGIIDCMFREDAEAAMRVYEQRDALAAKNGAMRELIGATGFKSERERLINNEAEFDAYLNSVRADVIKQLHSEQKEWALVTWQYDSFDALKRAAVRHGDSELSGVIFMLDRIEGFAAQLRGK